MSASFQSEGEVSDLSLGASKLVLANSLVGPESGVPRDVEPTERRCADMLSHALDYAARGLPVLPCGHSGKGVKRPLVPRDLDAHGQPIPNTGGVAKATTDPDQIRVWWKRWPLALVGAAMGRELRLLAIDPDVPKKYGDADGLAAWNALVAEHGGIPSTHAHETPSGGRHYIFRMPEGFDHGNREGVLQGRGINVRGTGGYLIMTPSRLYDGRVYRLLDDFDFWRFAPAPAWLLDLVTAAPGTKGTHVKDEPRSVHRISQVFAPHAVQAPLHTFARDRYVAAAVESECAAVAGCAKGGRNNRLNQAAFALGQFVGAGVLDQDKAEQHLQAAATACGHVADKGEDATEATIASGLNAGLANPRDLSRVQKRTRQQEEAGTQAKQNDSADGTASPSSRSIVGPLTEDAVALLFAQMYRDRLRYCHDHGAWFKWTGAMWQRNGTSCAFHYARELAREMAQGQDRASETAAGRAAFAGAVERFARADPTFAVEAAHWDRDPWLLGTPGGVVELRTGLLRPATPDDGITKATAVAPAAMAHCPLWLRFLKEATNGDEEMIRFLQLWAGYSLTGDTREHALVFTFGPGGNGKSVAVNAQVGIMGDYAVTASMDTFIASKSDRHSTDLAMLRGARLVTASETEEGRQWAESRIKQLTGGDRITARFMRQDFFTFLPSFKLQIIGNHKPGLRNVDDAARRRFNLVPFVHTPASPDRLLEEKLKAEWPGILRWAIEGCLAWQRDGLVRPRSVSDATAAYFAEQDTFRTWLDEECDVDPGNCYKSGTSAELFAAWSHYARTAGEDAMTRKAFSERMQRAGFEVHRAARGVRVYRGIRLVLTERVDAFGDEHRAH